MLLIALVGVGGFTVLAQRRLRSIGMLAAQGATERNIRLVVRANGVATGVVGAVGGAFIGFVGWLIYLPTAQASAHHVIGVLQLPWTVIGVSVILAILASYFAASRPAKAVSRVPIVAALSGRPPEPKKTGRLPSRWGPRSSSARSCCSAWPARPPATAAASPRAWGRSSWASSR